MEGAAADGGVVIGWGETMPKGMAEGREALTAAVSLRQMIRELEIGVASIDGCGLGVLHLLRTRDKVESEIARLGKQGMDLRAEMTRIEVVDSIFARKAGHIGRELREVGGLAGARRSENPPLEHSWWYVDVALAQRRHKVAIKGVTIAIGVLLLLMVSNYLLDKFFGLDPIQKQARIHTTQAERHLLSGDYADAIAEYERAVAVDPSDGQPRIQLGVLYEMEGRTEEAQAALAAAEAAIGDRADYLVVLSQAYQGLGDPEAAVAAVQEAIDLKPDFALAYMIRGGLHEQMGKTEDALADYEYTADLAQDQGNDQLYVVAKVRLAMTLQSAPSTGGPGGGF